MGWGIAVIAVALVVLGAPLFVVLGVVTLGSVYFLGDGFLVSIMEDMYYVVDKDVMLSIPFFIIAGAIMTAGGISRRLVNVGKSFVGWMPGGLAISSVTACVIFAAISGSSPATVIAIGSMMFPAMLKHGYKERFTIGLLASSGTLGILIPPSIPMIIYAIVVGTPQTPVSVAELFLAGVFPGLLIAIALALYSITNSLKNHNEDRAPFEIKNVFYALKDGIWALLLPVVILGGIYSGFFTPTEAGAIAVVYAAIVEFFIHHELKISRIPQIFADSAQMMGTLFLIMVIAIAFTKFLTLEQIPQQAVQWIGGFIESKFTFLIAVNLFLLVIGCFMDVISAILILGPILAPMAMHYGIHPIHFGIIFIVNLQIGYCTPPIGLNLFVASSIFKRDLGLVIRSVVPFALILLVSLLIISYVPAISLFLLDVL